MSLSDIPEESQNEILDYLLISSLTIRRTTDDHVRLCTRASGLQRVSAAALIRRLVSDGLASAFADDWGREHLSITAKGVDRLSRRTVKELRLAREKRNADYYDYWTQSGNAFLQLAIDRATLREGGGRIPADCYDFSDDDRLADSSVLADLLLLSDEWIPVMKRLSKETIGRILIDLHSAWTNKSNAVELTPAARSFLLDAQPEERRAAAQDAMIFRLDFIREGHPERFIPKMHAGTVHDLTLRAIDSMSRGEAPEVAADLMRKALAASGSGRAFDAVELNWFYAIALLRDSANPANRKRLAAAADLKRFEGAFTHVGFRGLCELGALRDARPELERLVTVMDNSARIFPPCPPHSSASPRRTPAAGRSSSPPRSALRPWATASSSSRRPTRAERSRTRGCSSSSPSASA